MPSIVEQRQNRRSQFEPKWRHFHPQSRVWVKNPFDHDVIFYVADEANEQYQYKMPSNRISELPGGAIATLGVKEIVDRLIGQSSVDATHIWVLRTRAKYEAQIIVKIKDPPQRAAKATGGEVNLASDFSEEDLNDDDDGLQAQHSTAAPDAVDNNPRPKAPAAPNPDLPAPGARRPAGPEKRGLDKVKAISAASAPTGDRPQIVEEP
jgi:hypothetical protein